MRRGLQTCEGVDWRQTPQRQVYCLSQAHWQVELSAHGRAWTVYLCSSCHAMAELGWAEKAIPRHTDFSAQGYPRERGHDAANVRHDRAFADVYKPKSIEQQLTFTY